MKNKSKVIPLEIFVVIFQFFKIAIDLGGLFIENKRKKRRKNIKRNDEFGVLLNWFPLAMIQYVYIVLYSVCTVHIYSFTTTRKHLKLVHLKSISIKLLQVREFWIRFYCCCDCSCSFSWCSCGCCCHGISLFKCKKQGTEQNRAELQKWRIKSNWNSIINFIWMRSIAVECVHNFVC